MRLLGGHPQEKGLLVGSPLLKKLSGKLHRRPIIELFVFRSMREAVLERISQVAFATEPGGVARLGEIMRYGFEPALFHHALPKGGAVESDRSVLLTTSISRNIRERLLRALKLVPAA